MSETLRITCPCGYENWVPAEKRGQVVPCFICGEELLIEESASTDQHPSSSPSTQSISSTPSTSSRPRSPFEADDLETAVRPKFQHTPLAPVPSAPPPTARPRNPFEADVPEENAPTRGGEENFVADPFSRELIPAPKPAPSMIDEMEKHRPTERRSRHTFIDTISPHDAPTGETCMQCGKPLRGSWDRIETHLGVFCYVCSNQATHDVPDRVKTGSGMRTELRETELLVDPADVHKATRREEGNSATEPSSGLKKTVWWMAWGMLGLTAVIWFTGWGSYVPDGSALDEPAPRIPDFFRYIVLTIRVIGAFVGGVLAIYLTLDRDARLPHERFLLNFINIGALVLLMGIMLFGIQFVHYFFIEDPIVSLMFRAFGSLLFFGTWIYLLIDWFDFQISDFAWLLFLYMPAAQSLFFGVGYLLQWALVQWVV